MGTDDTNTLIKSDLTLLTIVDGLHDLGNAGVTELANYVGLNKGTVYKHLQSLKTEGWVIDEDGSYRLSLKFFRYGMGRVNDITLCTHGKQKIVELANETDLPTGFMIKEGHKAVRIARIKNQSRYDVMADTISYPLHATASGKAILSALSEEEVRQIADETGLPEFTDDTITDTDELLEHLAEIRDRGYALNDEETSQRWNGIATPVEDPREQHVGAIYIGWPGRAISDSNLEAIVDPLLAAADEIYLELEY